MPPPQVVLRYLADYPDDHVSVDGMHVHEMDNSQWCDFTADESLEDSSQLSWHTPEHNNSNTAVSTAGMPLQNKFSYVDWQV